MHRDHVLFYCDSTKDLAQSILDLPSAHYISKGDIAWQKFDDGFPNLMIKEVQTIRFKNCIVLLDFFNIEKIFAQLAVVYALPRYYIRSLTVILPYFPTGTMERVDTEGTIATAMTLARLLSGIPLSAFGPARLVIYDIHALQERFYFSDNVIPILSSAFPLFLEQLEKKHANEKIAIAFPDDGAYKRFNNQFKNFKIIVCTKEREDDTRKVTIGEGQEHCSNSHIFIVDDLVQTGGTLLECKKALRKFGAKFVSAFVTHAVFPKESWRKFTSEPEDVRFKYFYVTNSCPPTVQQIKDIPPFQVLDLAPSLLGLITNYRYASL